MLNLSARKKMRLPSNTAPPKYESVPDSRFQLSYDAFPEGTPENVKERAAECFFVSNSI